MASPVRSVGSAISNAGRRSLSTKVENLLNSSIMFKETTDLNRRNIQELSPRLWTKFNPGYRLQGNLLRSEMKSQFKDHNSKKHRRDQLSVDKYYHRRRDQLSTYGEAFFKDKILYTKK